MYIIDHSPARRRPGPGRGEEREGGEHIPRCTFAIAIRSRRRARARSIYQTQISSSGGAGRQLHNQQGARSAHTLPTQLSLGVQILQVHLSSTDQSGDAATDGGSQWDTGQQKARPASAPRRMRTERIPRLYTGAFSPTRWKDFRWWSLAQRATATAA